MRRAAAACAAVLVAVSLAGCGSAASTDGSAGKGGAAAARGATPGSEPPAEPAVPARRASSVVVPGAPVSARLPSGTVVPIRGVSTRADGELAVPRDVRTAGWWRGGARLGDPFGSMLVAAHVDSGSQGLGPYAELLRARPGQRVQVASRRLVQDFVIRSLRLVPQAPLTQEGVIFSPSGPARLTLVTCAPPYVRSRGGYQNLAVVTAVPVSPPHGRKSP
jgi:hypothetical protein